MKVKALITAAGMGKRFGALTKITNKSLFHIEGKPLIGHLLERLREVGVREICVVTGHQSEQLEKHLGQAKRLYNPFYKVSGILGSFWAAKSRLEGHPFVFTTSDHFFHPNLLKGFLKSREDLLVLVQKKKSYTKEDAKVIIKNSRVVRMGKDIPRNQADGEFGGMVLFSARASRLFFEELEKHFKRHDVNGYMMEILVTISHQSHIPIRYALCQEGTRIEIDSVPDLIAARQMAKKFKGSYKKGETR